MKWNTIKTCILKPKKKKNKRNKDLSQSSIKVSEIYCKMYKYKIELFISIFKDRMGKYQGSINCMSEIFTNNCKVKI